MYPPEFNDKLKNRIRERDRWTCAICDRPGADVHHINYIKRDTHGLNLITLCRRCHSITNGNRDEWRYHLTKIVIGRPTLPAARPLPKKYLSEDAKRRMYAHQKEYRCRKKTSGCIKWLHGTGVNAYNEIVTVSWGAVQKKLYRKLVSYIALPRTGDNVIIISSAGKSTLPKDEDDLYRLIYGWIFTIPDHKHLSASRDVSAFMKHCGDPMLGESPGSPQ